MGDTDPPIVVLSDSWGGPPADLDEIERRFHALALHPRAYFSDTYRRAFSPLPAYLQESP